MQPLACFSVRAWEDDLSLLRAALVTDHYIAITAVTTCCLWVANLLVSRVMGPTAPGSQKPIKDRISQLDTALQDSNCRLDILSAKELHFKPLVGTKYWGRGCSERNRSYDKHSRSDQKTLPGLSEVHVRLRPRRPGRTGSCIAKKKLGNPKDALNLVLNTGAFLCE